MDSASDFNKKAKTGKPLKNNNKDLDSRNCQRFLKLVKPVKTGLTFL